MYHVKVSYPTLSKRIQVPESWNQNNCSWSSKVESSDFGYQMVCSNLNDFLGLMFGRTHVFSHVKWVWMTSYACYMLVKNVRCVISWSQYARNNNELCLFQYSISCFTFYTLLTVTSVLYPIHCFDLDLARMISDQIGFMVYDTCRTVAGTFWSLEYLILQLEILINSIKRIPIITIHNFFLHLW